MPVQDQMWQNHSLFKIKYAKIIHCSRSNMPKLFKLFTVQDPICQNYSLFKIKCAKIIQTLL